jgi:hypothetical protein
MTHPNIEFAINYLLERGTMIPIEMLAQLRGLALPSEVKDRKEIIKSIKAGLIHSREMKADEYSVIRDGLWISVFDSVFDYLNGDLNIVSAKNKMTLALSQAYIDTSETAYQDGGGSLPLDEDTASTANGELQAQLGYADSLFSNLKQLKKEDGVDANAEGADIADRWSSALDGFYNTIKLSGAGNKMLTWNLGDTENHCGNCSSLDGQRHRASWYLGKGYTPRKPGSNTECGGYNCDCSLTDDDGEEFTI